MERTIAHLQAILARLGYLTATPEHNVLDEVTRAALQRFQQLHALEPADEPDEHLWELLLAANQRGECVVAGQVVDQFGPIARATVAVRERDLGDPDGWPELGAAATDPDGRFILTYTMEQVRPGDRTVNGGSAVADLIFDFRELPVRADGFEIVRLPEGEHVAPAEKALGIQARRLEEVQIVVNTSERPWEEGASEYERLLAAFRAVWPELSPAELDDGRREPAFVARELGVLEDQIDALVSAFRLTRRPFDGTVPEAILYGLARCDQNLSDLARLALVTPGRLKEGIFQAVERLIIPPQPDDVIELAIRNIRQFAPQQLLNEADAPGRVAYGAVLRTALPDEAQQMALLHAAARHERDPEALWESLRSHPAFDAPGTIERAQFALQLDTLTGRHLPLMEALQREEGVTSTRTLLTLGYEKLKEIVLREGIGVPEGTPGEQPEEQIEAYVSGLVGQLQLALPTETVAQSIMSAPAEVLDNTLRQSLAAVLTAATADALRAEGKDFDIRTTHIDSYLATHGAPILAEVAEELRPRLVAELKRAQRLYRVSTGPESFSWLLKNSYSSAFAIAQVPRQTFMLQAQAELGEHQAMMMHTRAVETSAMTLATHVNLHDTIFGLNPAAIFGEHSIPSPDALGQAVATYLPSWSALFGQVSWCDCAHCRSVYSPAAYLVDLLNFLDKSARNAQGQTPLDVLLTRRPDIAQLTLTCENTNTVIPYVDLVNEVLESLAVSLDPLQIPPFDTGSAPTSELQAAPQHTNAAAYVTPDQPDARARLDRAIYPASLPFDAALLAARTYLEQLGVSRADLIAAFSDPALTNALAAERLGLSPNAFAVITGVGLDETPANFAIALEDRFGWNLPLPMELALEARHWLVWVLKQKLNTSGAALPVGANPGAELFDAATQTAVQTFQAAQGLPATGSVDATTWTFLLPLEPGLPALLSYVPILLERAGLRLDELQDLLKIRYVNLEQPTFDIALKLRLPAADLLAFVQAGLQNPGGALVDALTVAGVPEADFTAWAQTQLADQAWLRFQETILLDAPPGDPCDLSAMIVRHWDTAAPAISEAEWIKLDSLIRLWRVLGWELSDLDLALTALGAPALSAPVIRQLAQIQRLASLLDISISQVVALWTDLDPARPGSLYARRFRNRTVLRIDPAFEPDWSGRILASATIGAHSAALQAGLRISGADLLALRAHLGLADDAATLDLASLSGLFRHVTLARALRINVRDLVEMLRLSGLQPFQPPADDWSALTFVAAVQRLQESGLNVAQLAFVLADTSAPEANQARDRMLLSLRDQLRAIAADLDAASETDGSLTRRVLALLQVDPRLVERALPGVLGTDETTIVVQPAPDPLPVIPQEWAERLRYNPRTRAIACRGALTDAERQTVRAFSGDASYQNAVDALYGAPFATLQQLATALEAQAIPFPPVETLLADSLFVEDLTEREAKVRARLKLILEAILPPLRERLSRTLVKQTLTALPLDAATIALLLEGQSASGLPLFPASDPTRPLISDLLDLATSPDTSAATRAYELLNRLRVLLDSLALKADDVQALAQHLIAFRASPNQLCSYASWEIIAAYARIRSRPGQLPGRLAQLWQATTPVGVQGGLAELLGWPEETIAGLLSALALGVAELQQLVQLERLITAGEHVQTLGVPAAQAASWARQPADQALVDAIRRAVKARYDEAAWLDVARPLSDTQRDAQRAALVAYLFPRLGVSNADGLYAKLLIDVEMGPCMQTSRIKQAISSVQLFIQRCLLNLEPQVSPQSIDSQHWQWMQHYRVWEANRKVLLYPENWILPELRDDKTPFFKELESALLQDDVTDQNAERALIAYLEKLDTVARLEIIALHVQEEFAPQEKLQTVVHIFGRTANQAPTYYYRRYVVTQNGTALWTPWEPMPLDIQGRQIAPVIFNRRLYLFWAIVTTKQKEPPQGSTTPQPVKHYQEITLAWSEYRNGAWSPKQVSDTKQALKKDFDPNTLPIPSIYGQPDDPGVLDRLEARVEQGQLTIYCIGGRFVLWADAYKGGSGGSGMVDAAKKLLADSLGEVNTTGSPFYIINLGSFRMDSCNGQLVKQQSAALIKAKRGDIFGLLDGTLQVARLAKIVKGAAVLNRTSSPSRITETTWVHEGSDYLVFSDSSRTYFTHFSPAPPIFYKGLTTPSLVSPNVQYPEIKPAPKDGSYSSETVRLKAVRRVAEQDANTWASANAALAALALDPAAGVDGDGDQHAWQEGGVKKAALIEDAISRSAGQPQDFSVAFETLFHPFVCTYIARLRQSGVAGVLTPQNQQLNLVPGFERYQPERVVKPPFPMDGVDFGATEKPGIYRTSAYSDYNWELFFHIPMLIAARLSQNLRFDDAMRWLHYVFNPTDGRGGYWKFLPFQQIAAQPLQTIEAWLKQLNAGDPDLQRQIAEWKDHPFEPHRIGRMRLPAYMKYVVMRYIDNLIAWGDRLFERDTIESINQATQLYVMAAELLGPRPQRIVPRGQPEPLTFAQMRGKLDALGNLAAEYENAFPALSSATMAATPETVGLLGISQSLYFCLPPNDKLLGYWDTVADRLFKIRNCMNLAGVVRQLPLFEPPIDPALLVRAVAQGIDLGSVLSDLSAPLPHYRFRSILPKALEACAELKSLGAALLAALEKKDADALALLRACHETALLKAALETRRQQELEADEQVSALTRSREGQVERLRYYRWLMGGDDGAAPAPGAEIPMLPYGAKPAAAEGVFLIQEEQDELSASHSARDWEIIAGTSHMLASLLSLIPTLSSTSAPGGIGINTVIVGGQTFGPALTALAQHQRNLAQQDSYDARHAEKMAGYKRRLQDYAIQANSAAREIMQIDKQITAASIRKTVARLEREHTEAHIQQCEVVEEHYTSKYTNVELYGWMQGQISGLYFQSYQLAYELAKQAERCFRFEHGLTTSSYVQFGAWDSLHKGLLAGETLHLQLKQLERAYQDQHRRDFELTKHVSLLQHAPLALIRLKQTGRCEFDLPELFYDMDYPGHYMRRISSVSITIPAVVGPYVSVNATLTMLANETRIHSTLSASGAKYERDYEREDSRFVNDFAAIQAIATSSGQNDSGMFELSFRDERYLPFEGAGAAGRWRIEIDPDCNRFDLSTISDIVLHIKYTARDAGERLRQKAKEHWKNLLADQENLPLTRLFSLKHEFPGEWHRLRTVAEANGDHLQTIALGRDRFPRILPGRTITIGKLDIFGVPKKGGKPTKLPTFTTPKPTAAVVELTEGAPLKPLLHQTGLIQVVVQDGGEQALWRLAIANEDVAASLDQLEDILLVCHYSVKSAPG